MITLRDVVAHDYFGIDRDSVWYMIAVDVPILTDQLELITGTSVNRVLVLPGLVVHADWSTDAAKRWSARAVLGVDGRYTAHAPQPVGEAGYHVARAAADAGPGGCALLGFDFPIGLPAAYAHRAGIASFRDAVPSFGQGDWARFYEVAERPDEIGPFRPFYPRRPGGTSQRRLLDAHGVEHIGELRRRCERRTPNRAAASPLFWTLGGQQVGKAAIAGWRDVVVPALRHPTLDVRLWPFDGDLAALLGPGRVVLAETYPGDAYGYLGVDLRLGAVDGRRGKRRQGSRRANAGTLLTWLGESGVRATAELAAEIRDGFGPRGSGEDAFDAVVGLFGMLEVVLGRRPEGAPPEPEVRAVEGWILGAAREQG